MTISRRTFFVGKALILSLFLVGFLIIGADEALANNKDEIVIDESRGVYLVLTYDTTLNTLIKYTEYNLVGKISKGDMKRAIDYRTVVGVLKIADYTQYGAGGNILWQDFYKYDDQGKLLSKETVNFITEVSTVYSYNQAGELKSLSQKTNQGLSINDTEFTYVNDKKLVLRLRSYDGRGQLTKTELNTYSETGQLLVKEVSDQTAKVKNIYNYNNSGFVLTFSQKTLDTNKFIRTISYIEIGGKKYTKGVNVYDVSGILIKKEENGYSSTGILTTRTISDLVDQLKNVYKYDPKGTLLTSVQYDLSSGLLVKEISYLNISDKNYPKEINNYNDGELIITNSNEYNQGFLTTLTSLDYQKQFKYVYHYNPDGSLSYFEKYDLVSNLLITKLTFFVKNERNLLGEREEFDLTGKLVSKTTYTYSDTGDPLSQTTIDYTTDETVVGDYVDLADLEDIFGVGGGETGGAGSGGGSGSGGGTGGGGNSGDGGAPIVVDPPVIDDPINTPPTISLPTNLIGKENELMSLDILVNDIDSTAVNITVNNLPLGASQTTTFDEVTKSYKVKVLWTPNFDQAGSYTFSVLADDGFDASVENIDLQIDNNNRSPIADFITSLIPDGSPEPGWQFDAGSLSQIVFSTNIIEQDADPFTWQWFLNGQAISSGVEAVSSVAVDVSGFTVGTVNNLKLVVTDAYNAVTETILGVQAVPNALTYIFSETVAGLSSPGTRYADLVSTGGYLSPNAILIKGDAWTEGKVSLAKPFTRSDFSKHTTLEFVMKETANGGPARTLQLTSYFGDSKIVNLNDYSTPLTDGWVKVAIPISSLAGGTKEGGVNKVEFISFGPKNPAGKYFLIDNVGWGDGAKEKVPPVVVIDSLANGDNISDIVSVAVSASDNTGVVSKVELYLDGNLILTKEGSPFTWQWNTTVEVNGEHTVIAKAYDQAGNIGESAPVVVTISNIPVVDDPALTYIFSETVAGLSSPGTRYADLVSTGGYLSPNAILIKGDAWTEGKVSLAKPFTRSDFSKHTTLEFVMKETANGGPARTLQLTSYFGDSKIVNLNDYSTPLTDGWVKVAIPISSLAGGTKEGGVNKVEFISFGPKNPAGKYFLIDNVGWGDGAGVLVEDSGDILAPIVVIESPSNNQIITGTTTVNISAVDESGVVSKVEIYEDGVLGGTDILSPFTFAWGTQLETNGPHTLQAKAYDQAGNVGTSTVVTITINNPTEVTKVVPGSLPAGVSFTGVVGVVSVEGNRLTVKPNYYKPNLANAPFQFKLMSTTTTLSNIVLASSTPNISTNMWPAKYYSATADGVEGFRWYPNPSLAGSYQLLFTAKNSAGQTLNIPVQITINKPLRVCTDKIAGTNTYTEACATLQSLYDQGLASGNLGDYYDNRDSQHADYIRIPTNASTPVEISSPTPEVGTTRPESLPLGVGTTGGPIVNAYSSLAKGMIIGNASTGLSKCSIECDHMSFYYDSLLGKTPSAVELLADSNYLFLAPALATYKPGVHFQEGYGDVYVANSASGVISSVGASGTELRLVKALFYALAAFKPAVKQEILNQKLMATTLQMLLRRNVPDVSEADYLTAKAHSASFNQYTVVTDDMLKNLVLDAQSITLASIPPKVTFSILDSNATKVAGKSETLISEPAFASFVHLADEYKKIFNIRVASKKVAGQTLSYKVVALNGKGIKITKLNTTDFKVEIPYQKNSPIFPGSDVYSSRVDIGIFADNGTFVSAPAILAVNYKDDEIRNYNSQGSLLGKFTSIANTQIGFVQEINTTNGFKTDIYDWLEVLNMSLSGGTDNFSKDLLREYLAKIKNRNGQVIGLNNIEAKINSFLPSFTPIYNAYLGNQVDLTKANTVRVALDTRSGNTESIRYIILQALNDIKDDYRLYFDHQDILKPLLEVPSIVPGSGTNSSSWASGVIGQAPSIFPSVINKKTDLSAVKTGDDINLVYSGSATNSEAALVLRFDNKNTIDLNKLYPAGLDFKIKSPVVKGQGQITEVIVEMKGGSKYTSVKLNNISDTEQVWHIDLIKFYPVDLSKVELIRFRIKGLKTASSLTLTLPGIGNVSSSETWVYSLDNRSYYISSLLNQIVTGSAGVTVDEAGAYTLNESLLTDYDQYLIRRLNMELLDAVIFPSFMSRYFKAVTNYVPTPLK